LYLPDHCDAPSFPSHHSKEYFQHTDISVKKLWMLCDNFSLSGSVVQQAVPLQGTILFCFLSASGFPEFFPRILL